jgi:imidazolonepropionase-like amidohydrolase
VLLAVTAPTGGLVAGQSAVLQLDGWTWEDMCVRDAVAMQIQWPSAERRGFGRRRGPDRGDSDNDYRDQITRLRELFEETSSYLAGREARGDEQPTDLRLESMIPVVKGEMPLMVRADTLRQIQDAVAFGAEHNVRVIILGGYDAPLCAELLKKHEVPVIVSAVHRRPLRRDDEWDAAYTLPRRLHELGIPFCISCTDRSETWNTRNLPHQAAMAAGYGLPRDVALRSVTLFPAQILGVADRVGSLEPGKDATLFVADGDALEITTTVTDAWVAGKRIDLSNRHTRLYERYRDKYSELENGRTTAKQ